MRIQGLLYGAAALTLFAAPAFAQNTTISPQSPMATPNSMNATGPTACASAQDPKSCQGKTVVVVTDTTATDQAPAAVEPAPAPTRLYTSDYNPSTPPATVSVVSNGPVPDTPENRARFGGPMSRAGNRTAPVGN